MANVHDMETELKVIVVGNGQVGKTSMITRFAQGLWTDSYKKTIGTDFMEKDIYLDNQRETVRLMLWDTAGQEMFAELTKAYYKGAGAVVYVFSTTDRQSFEDIERWKMKVERECGPLCAVLVQNKVDLLDLDHPVIRSSEAEDLARRLGMKLYRTCVKDNVLVDDVFRYLAESFVKQGGQSSLQQQQVPDIGVVSKKEAPSTDPDDAPEQPVQNNFKLVPTKQRTSGKKKMRCLIL